MVAWLLEDDPQMTSEKKLWCGLIKPFIGNSYWSQCWGGFWLLCMICMSKRIYIPWSKTISQTLKGKWHSGKGLAFGMGDQICPLALAVRHYTSHETSLIMTVPLCNVCSGHAVLRCGWYSHSVVIVSFVLLFLSIVSLCKGRQEQQMANGTCLVGVRKLCQIVSSAHC